MRKTREQLLIEFPSWNESRNNIVDTYYGDKPLCKYDKEWYEKYKKLTGTLANIEAVNTYMFARNGNYYKYWTGYGDVYVSEDGKVLCGDMKIKYRGIFHDIILNKMYGYNALTILRMSGGKVVGFSNEDGQGSPSSKLSTSEMETDLIERILNDKMEDFGIGVQKFMEAARKLYAEDTRNHIMEKCFS